MLSLYVKTQLVGGFNPFEKYESNGIISPNRGGKNEKCLKPPTRQAFSSTQGAIRGWGFLVFCQPGSQIADEVHKEMMMPRFKKNQPQSLQRIVDLISW